MADGQRRRSTGSGSAAIACFIVAICGVIAAALQLFLVETRFGAQLRAAVDDPRVADGLGINVGRIFAVAFAVGSGLAGLGGALAADVVGGVDPSFPVKFLVTSSSSSTIGGSNGILGRARPARCCSACSTSPANITSPRSAASSSMR